MRTFAKSSPFNQARRARGVTLVELLVAMVISLIAITAIFQVFSVFEGQKRTTMGGGEAQTNGALALFSLERDLRQAGYGVNSTDFLGCDTLAHDEPSGTDFPMTLLPVQIVKGPAGAPDTLTMFYGSGDLIPQSVNIIQNMAQDVVPYRVSNRFGFQPGDVLIAAESGKKCSLSQVDVLPGLAGQQDLIQHNSGNYVDPATGASLPTRYNKPGGLGEKYTFSGKLFNLGPRPAYNIYTVQNSQLMVQQMLSAPSTAVTGIYDGIVQLQAQYGKDDGVNNGTVTIPAYVAGDGIIDNFSDVAPANATEWAQMFAVRLAVVARSNLREKVDPNDGLCHATDTAPSWAGGTINLAVTDPNWQCYRYKVFQTVVPIRNMIWRP